jgi:hypothetical protein
MLESFAAGKDLPVAVLPGLAQELYSIAIYDVASGMLKPTRSAEAQTLPDTASYLPRSDPNRMAPQWRLGLW